MLPLATILLLTLPTSIASTALPQPQHLSPPHQQKQQPLSSNANIKTHFHPITRPDLPSITTLILDAFSPWPTWKYLMPEYEEHKAEVWEYMFLQLQHAYERYEKINAGGESGETKREMGRVITVSKREFDKGGGGGGVATENEDDENQEENEERIAVSVALWQILTHDHPSSSAAAATASSPSLLNDDDTITLSPFFPLPFPFTATTTTSSTSAALPPYTNLTRAQHFNHVLDPIKDKYILSAYPRQLYLNLLATHPKWDGNGFGARQVEWGEKLAENLSKADLEGEEGQGKGVPLTLIGTPVGWENLYEGLGFEGVRNVTYEMLDGLGQLWWEVGRWGV